MLHNKARYLCSMVIYSLVVKYDQELVLCELKKKVWPGRDYARNRADLITCCITQLGYSARNREDLTTCCISRLGHIARFRNGL